MVSEWFPSGFRVVSERFFRVVSEWVWRVPNLSEDLSGGLSQVRRVVRGFVGGLVPDSWSLKAFRRVVWGFVRGVVRG